MIWKKISAVMVAGALLFSLAGFAWVWQEDLEAVQGTAEKNTTQSNVVLEHTDTLQLSALLEKQQMSTAQSRVDEALDKLIQAQSAHSVLTMDMEVEVFKLNLNAIAIMDMVSFRSPVQVKSDISLDLGILGDNQMEVYAREQNTGYQLFLKDGDGWRAQQITAAQLHKYDGQQMMQTFLEQIKDIEVVGTEKLDSGTAYKFTGVIRSDGLQAILLDTGSLGVVAELFQGSILKPFGALLEHEEKISALMKDAEDLEVTLWIDEKTGYPVKGAMDITQMMSDGYKQLYRAAASGKSIWSRIEIEKSEIVIECGEFNCAEEIIIPKAALLSVCSVEKMVCQRFPAHHFIYCDTVVDPGLSVNCTGSRSGSVICLLP